MRAVPMMMTSRRSRLESSGPRGDAEREPCTPPPTIGGKENNIIICSPTQSQPAIRGKGGGKIRANRRREKKSCPVVRFSFSCLLRMDEEGSKFGALLPGRADKRGRERSGFLAPKSLLVPCASCALCKYVVCALSRRNLLSSPLHTSFLLLPRLGILLLCQPSQEEEAQPKEERRGSFE